MKYTDRYSIGLEQILLEQLSPLDGIGSILYGDDEDGEDYPGAFGREITLTADKAVGVCMSLMEKEQPEAYAAIPENIRESYDVRGSDREQRLGAFMDWFLELRRVNDRMRVERTAGLNNFCSGISGSQADSDMARTFFSLNNQRVIVSREDSEDGLCIVVRAAEREWGRCVFRFAGCRAAAVGGATDAVDVSSAHNSAVPDSAAENAAGLREMLPVPGFLYSFEGTVTDSGFHVDMLIDTGFGADEYPDRLLSDSGWHEIGFDCESVSAEPVFYDYAGRMQRMGTPRAELIERCCELLVSKSEILGSYALTEDERAFLPAAMLIRGTGAILDRDDSDSENHFRHMIFEALDNRYAMRVLCRRLEDLGGSALKKELERTLDSFGQDEADTVIKRAISFRGMLESGIADGSARPLLAGMADMMCSMTAGLSGDHMRSEPETELLSRLRNAAAPELERMGFSGNYPHYFRQRGGNMEYISIMLDYDTDKPRRGIISYYATVAAAQLPSSRFRVIEEMGVPRDRANALDCLPEEIGLCNYGELAGRDDGQYVRMDINVYGDRCVTHDESGRLAKYIGLAESQFVLGRIPWFYRGERLRARANRGALGRSLAACSPVGVVTAVILLLVYNFTLRGQAFYTLSNEVSAIAALAGGVIALCAAALIRNLIRSFSIWRY